MNIEPITKWVYFCNCEYFCFIPARNNIFLSVLKIFMMWFPNSFQWKNLGATYYYVVSKRHIKLSDDHLKSSLQLYFLFPLHTYFVLHALYEVIGLMPELFWIILCEVGRKERSNLYFPHQKQNSKPSISSPPSDKQQEKALDSPLCKGKKMRKWGSDVK